MVQLAEQQGVARAQEPGLAIRTARRSDEAAVMSFLRRDAPTNLFVLAWIARHGVVRNGGGITFSFYVAQSPRTSHIVGVCLLVSQRMAMPFGLRSACKAFGERLRRLAVDLDHVVGEREAVRGLWSTYGWGRTPRLDRPQSFMVLDKLSTPPTAHSPVRRARRTDLDKLIPLARAMYREEALVDPCRGEPGTFRRIQETRIRRGQVYVWRHADELVFKTDISSFDPRFGAQLAGVYTIPARRGEGIATRALRDICSELLQHVPRVTLYVNEDNAGARRLYQRLGFREHAGWLSIFIN